MATAPNSIQVLTGKLRASHVLLYIAALVGVAALLFPAPLTAHGGLCKLTLLDAPTLIVDPTCSTCDGASVTLQLRNDSSQMVELALTTGDFKNKAGGLLNAKARFTPVTSLTKGMVVPGQVVKVQMEVRNVLEDGEWEAELHNRGVNIGNVKVVKTHVPLGIRLDLPNPDQPEILIQRGKAVDLGFKNDDAISYPLIWELTLDGRNGRAPSGWKGTKQAGNLPSATEALMVLPAKGAARVSFHPPREWFHSGWWPPGGWLCAILKGDDAQGHLTLHLRPLDCAECGVSPDAPAKVFSVKLHLSYYSKNRQDVMGTLLVLLALLLGALFSLFVNFVIPEATRRQAIKRQLSELRARIEGLPVGLSSRLRVLAGMELRRLTEGVKLVTWFSPERDTLVTEITQDLQRLGRRVNLLEKLGALRTRFDEQRVVAQPPTPVDEIEDLFVQTVEILKGLKLTDDDLQSAMSNITRIDSKLRSFGQANPELVHDLVERAVQLKKDFVKDGDFWRSPNLTPVRQELPGLFRQFQDAPEKPEEYNPTNYSEWDMVLSKLRLIRGYVRLLDARRSDDETYPRIRAKGHELLGYLKTFSWEALHSARRLVREMREDIFREQIRDRIREGRVAIEVDRSHIQRFEPVQLSLNFYEAAYNSAASRDEWTCTWDFGHPANPAWTGQQKNMTETGWSVSHYFPVAKEYTIKVNFRHQTDGELNKSEGSSEPATISDTIAVGTTEILGWKNAGRRVGRFVRSRWGGFARFLLALAPALLGLVAGAKEQLLKMDCVPALIAIFLVGFGSDQVKNLLGQKE